MSKFFKRLFKKQSKVVVYKNGKVRKFKSFSKAITFMLAG